MATNPQTHATRATVTFPKEHYQILERIAVEKKVSIAWVVRDAVEHYIGERWPLLEERRRR